jgi:phosphodiesterase/alkaline phosphatase D-like protein
MKRSTCILPALLISFLISQESVSQTITFTGSELLGKPTNGSIAVNIVPASTIELYYEYGTTQGGPYTMQTATTTATGGQPHEMVISGLSANTRYYYRMQYRTSGGSWQIRDEHYFQTQRVSGSSFVFTVTSDSHATFNTAHQQAMTNVKNDNPDFHLDLGDTFYSGNASSQSSINSSYLAYRNLLYLGAIGPSVPIFLAAGNHEDEEGWNLNDTPFSPAVGSIQARKAYYPTPVQDGFYSGNTDLLAAIDETTYGDEYREDYYAWTWGDALFVVIDEFQYTMINPYGAAAGEGSDDPDNADQWIWSLGAQQYNWFKQTLQNSAAKYKFVFSHNMLGGITRNISGVDAGYVRGGAEAAGYFEWGGNNADGTSGFASHRNSTDFGTTPIHQLMVANGVSAYFHGHDHQYVYEKRDGIVYQEVPSPSMSGSGFSGIYTEGDYSTYQTIKMLPNAGHLRITVTNAAATVDYVRSNQTGVSYTYTILPNDAAETYNLTMSVDPAEGGATNPATGTQSYDVGTIVNLTATPTAGYIFDHWSGNVANVNAATTTVTMNADQAVTAHFTLLPGFAGDMNGDDVVNSTDALIILSCDVGIDVSQFCPVNCADVNADGLVNSTDALIILSYDVGMTIPYPVGQPGCPSSVNPCTGCSP